MKHLHQNEKEELQRVLGQYGQSDTDEFVAVLDTFLSTEGHQTIEDIARRLKSRGLMFSQADVRDALDTFCRLGFAQAKTFNGQEPVYEHKHLGHHHDHLICTRCGKIEEFVSPQIENLQNEMAREKGFLPLEHRLEIYGLCGECSHQRGDAVPLSQAEKGERLLVCGCEGGDELQRRLMDMGMNPGAEIEVLGCTDGPIVVACRGARLALGRGMSDRIMVRPVRKPGPPHGFGRIWGRKKHRGPGG